MLRHFRTLRGTVGAGLLALATLGLGAGTAPAGDYCPPRCHYEWVTRYECVVTYETRTVPYTKVVTCYDHCGRPYQVTKTCYREVQVPVKKMVPVRQKVLVCD